MKNIIDKNEYVYCTNCVNGESLIDSIIDGNEDHMPQECIKCFPYNPEDSVKFKERPNYIALEN